MKTTYTLKSVGDNIYTVLINAGYTDRVIFQGVLPECESFIRLREKDGINFPDCPHEESIL